MPNLQSRWGLFRTRRSLSNRHQLCCFRTLLPIGMKVGLDRTLLSEKPVHCLLGGTAGSQWQVLWGLVMSALLGDSLVKIVKGPKVTVGQPTRSKPCCHAPAVLAVVCSASPCIQDIACAVPVQEFFRIQRVKHLDTVLKLGLCGQSQ